jgi:hypothetical protein
MWFEKSERERTGAFPVRVTARGMLPMSGVTTAVREGGMTMIARKAVPFKEFDVNITLHARPVNARVRVRSTDTIVMKSENWSRHDCTFVEMAPSDREFVARFVNNVPDMRKLDLPPARDSDLRTLPPEAQRKIVDALVAARRLSAPPRGTPELQFRLESEFRAEGRTIWFIAVMSAVAREGRTIPYETHFMVSSSGTVELRR